MKANIRISIKFCKIVLLLTKVRFVILILNKNLLI